jgi:Tfp pilus assembly protein PilF
MTPRTLLWSAALALLSLALSSLGQAQQPALEPLNTNLAPAIPSVPAASPDKSVTTTLREALQFMNQGKLDDALNKANAAILVAPQDPDAYGVRGTIYSQKKQNELALADFQKVLQLTPKYAPAKFNIAELSFRQKLYDQARPGFVELEQDPDLGDLATYKVFLCDLYAGHDDVAKRELDAFNQIGSNASYYFSNAAWSLYHHQIEDARGWLTSASHIYAPQKLNLFSSSLFDLGYLPLPPPPN